MPHVFGEGNKQITSARQDLHLRSPGPKPGMLLLHHALDAPAFGKAPGTWFLWKMDSPRLGHDNSIEDGGSGGICTRTLSADNGLLFCSATEPV